MTYGPYQNPFPSYPAGGGGGGGESPLYLALTVIPGLLFGAYENLAYNADPAEAAGGAAGVALGICWVAGEKIESINPNSTALYIVGEGIHWVIGVGSAIYAGIGGFFGALVPWAIRDVFSLAESNQQRSEIMQPAGLANLTVSYENRSAQMEEMKYAAINVTLNPISPSTAFELLRPKIQAAIREYKKAAI